MITYFPVVYYASLIVFLLKLEYVWYILNFGLLGSDAMQPVDGHHLSGEPAMYTLKMEDVASYMISLSRRPNSVSSPQSTFEIFIGFIFHHANKSDMQWYELHEFINVVYLKISNLVYISMTRRNSSMMTCHFLSSNTALRWLRSDWEGRHNNVHLHFHTLSLSLSYLCAVK